MGIDKIPEDKQIIFLAYNTHIKNELILKSDPQPNLTIRTVHSFGNEALRAYCPGFTVSPNKYRSIFRDVMDYHNTNNEAKISKYNFDKKHLSVTKKIKKIINTLVIDDFPVYTSNVVDLANLGRLYKIDPDIKQRGVTLLRKLGNLHSIPIDKKQCDVAWYLIKLGLFYVKEADYTDMLYIPIMLDLEVPQYDFVFIDECLPKDTFISTINGKMKIYNLFKKFNKNEKLPEVVTYNEKKKIFENKKILKIWSNGFKDVHQVILNGKRKLKSTVNHKFLTQVGWKRLDELKIGDAILSNYKEQPYHIIPTEIQKDIINGSIIGDGNIDIISNKVNRLNVIHGEKQIEYLKWKASFFDSKIEQIEKNGYSKKPAIRFYTKGIYGDFNKYNAIINLNIKSFAIAYMDDGNLAKNGLSSTLWSFSDNLELVELLSQKILKEFNIKGNVKKTKSSTTKKDCYYILFNKENTFKLSELLSPYINPNLKYKILDIHHYNLFTYKWEKETNEIGCLVVSKEHEFYRNEEVFDMTIEDNHNFILPSLTKNKKIKVNEFGIIAHNCQDISTCQRELMLKAIKPNGGRFIGVGDSAQSIYAFAGADEESFEALKNLPNTVSLPLSISYRCPKAIVDYVRPLNKQIEYREGNTGGEIIHSMSHMDIKDGDMILCRQTFPLVSLCIKYLSQGKKSYIIGSDIGKSLIKMIQNAKRPGVEYTMRNVLKVLYSDLQQNTQKLMDSNGLSREEALNEEYIVTIQENILAIEALSRGIENPDIVKKKIKDIFADDQTDGICLSTVHKSKGLENERVFILHPELIPSKRAELDWEVKQERNIEYVAYTRASQTLGFITDYDAFKGSQIKMDNIGTIETSKHIGKTNMKMKFDVKVISKRTVETKYGPSLVYDMIDDNGNVFFKWGEIKPKFLKNRREYIVDVNSELKFDGIIAGHEEYKGLKKTKIGKMFKSY
jgi:hypothetical protein